ncbi:uncharacterized protein [Drosophila bipectinata]|uniref:uncharacterized protein n=1 Tax=Drosophila bipectinata TaxID=42026 RepID=UPI0007E7D6BA|nr:uncharacterized protein LOC108120171 [Drosophila bipectinata]
MASLQIIGQPPKVIHTYQVIRIGSDENDKTLTYCIEDKSVDKLHATLTRYEKGLYLVNESRHGSVTLNGRKVGGPVHITYRDTYHGCCRLHFGHVEALLLVSGSLNG